MNKKTTSDEATAWEKTTWEGARREQLRRWSRLSLEEILAAQEEMADLADQLARTPTKPTHK